MHVYRVLFYIFDGEFRKEYVEFNASDDVTADNVADEILHNAYNDVIILASRMYRKRNFDKHTQN